MKNLLLPATLLLLTAIPSIPTANPPAFIPCNSFPLDSLEYLACGVAPEKKNYNTTYPDLLLVSTDPGHSVSLTAIPSLAGAVASVKLHGQELIATGGHGASFQFAFHPSSSVFPASECNNPTEAGSRLDDAGIPPGSYLGAPWLTNSTSGIISYWQGVAAGSPQLATYSNPAFYVPEGWDSEYSGSCKAFWHSSGGPVSGASSFYLLKKWLTLGMQVNGKYYPNVLQVDSLALAPQGAETLDITLVAYLTRRLVNELFFDPRNNTTYYKTPGQARDPNFNNLSVAPVVRIFADSALGTAVGVLVTGVKTQWENLPPRIYTLTNLDLPPVPGYNYIYRNIASQHGYTNVPVGVEVESHSYFVFGTVEEIKTAARDFCRQSNLCPQPSKKK